MAGFRKAKAEQAAIKMAIYGPPGSGKTFSTLLFVEGIAKRTKKRVAFVDTERGTDFYAQPVKEREAHPDAFDFDALYTRSLSDVLKECQALKFEEHAVIVIDSITHLWEAAIASYTGPKTKAGTIPMWAWSKIKEPYKRLMHFLINSPFHVFILGRQGNEFIEDEETGETKAAGVKMKAEGETPYEPHVCCRMESVKHLKKKGANKTAAMDAIPTLFAEKDRSGLLQGKVFEWPNFEKVIAPLMGLLGTKQAEVQSTDDAALNDAEANQKAEQERVASSRRTREQFEARFKLAKDQKEVESIAKAITPAVKKAMLATDVTALRDAYLAAKEIVPGTPARDDAVGAAA